MLYVIATLTIQPGSCDTVFQHALPCIEATRQETGCISYDLTQSLTDPDTLIFVERWKDKDALKAHFKQPHMAVWREKSGPYIVSRKIEIIENADIEIL